MLRIDPVVVKSELEERDEDLDRSNGDFFQIRKQTVEEDDEGVVQPEGDDLADDLTPG